MHLDSIGAWTGGASVSLIGQLPRQAECAGGGRGQDELRHHVYSGEKM